MGSKILDHGRHFWERVDKSGGPDACWPWLKSMDNHGYGCSWDGEKVVKAHIRAFIFTYGYQPPMARHSCDNPPCCNPVHLLGGTQWENMGDAADRNRIAFGEDHGMVKLTEQNVLIIRKRYTSRSCTNGGRALGREFGVSCSTIQAIIHKKHWRRLLSQVT